MKQQDVILILSVILCLFVTWSFLFFENNIAFKFKDLKKGSITYENTVYRLSVDTAATQSRWIKQTTK